MLLKPVDWSLCVLMFLMCVLHLEREVKFAGKKKMHSAGCV